MAAGDWIRLIDPTFKDNRYTRVRSPAFPDSQPDCAVTFMCSFGDDVSTCIAAVLVAVGMRRER